MIVVEILSPDAGLGVFQQEDLFSQALWRRVAVSA
jgi:hypothetical protein